LNHYLINFLFLCSSIKADDLKDILQSLHTEQINLQAARQLIELLHNNPEAKSSEVSNFKPHNI